MWGPHGTIGDQQSQVTKQVQSEVTTKKFRLRSITECDYTYQLQLIISIGSATLIAPKKTKPCDQSEVPIAITTDAMARYKTWHITRSGPPLQSHDQTTKLRLRLDYWMRLAHKIWCIIQSGPAFNRMS